MQNQNRNPITAISFLFYNKTTNNILFSNLYLCTMKPTQHYLEKLSAIVHEAGYTLRYERGTFQSGWCLLESKRVIVLNKFLDLEGRINILLELIPQLPVDTDKLTRLSQLLYDDIKKEAKTNA